MQAKQFNQADVLAAILVGAVGAGGIWLGRSLDWGTASAMGPGYLPLGLSWLLIGFAVAFVVRAFVKGGHALPRFSVWPALVLTSATIVFGLAIERLGFVATVFAVSMMATFAGEHVSWTRRFLISAILSASCVLVFVYLLGQQINLWWWTE